MTTNKRLCSGVLRNIGLRAVGLSSLILLSVTTVRADTVLDWNVTALKTTAAAPFNPPVESRNLAIVHAAMFDAVNSIVGEYSPYAIELRAPDGASPDAAAAAAAHYALVCAPCGSWINPPEVF